MISLMPQRAVVSATPPVGNRAQFLAAAAQRLAALPGPFPDLAVLSVVLPGMAEFHQTFGAAAADHLAQRVFAAVAAFVPESVIGRLADGHFAMTYEFDAEWSNIQDIVADLRDAIAAVNETAWLSLPAPPLIGAVVQSGPPPRGTSLDAATELLRQANLAAQLAGPKGQQGFMLYNRNEDDRIRSTAVLDQSLRQAITRHEFRLYYQPLVDLRTREMTGLEGLVRWQNPLTGLRGPEDFIAAAETAGLIVPIGAAVLGLAAAQINVWRDAGWAPPRVAVNVAAAQLQDPGFRDTIRRAVSLGAVTPANLELEMTERTLITWSSCTRRLLDVVRVMGITLALDDFGTGYSSLQYLRDMPISKLKIDSTFVRRVATDRRDAALVKTIVGLGDALGLTIVAEGIEQPDQAEALLDCGCTIGQGYLFSRPLPPADIIGMQAALRQLQDESPIRGGRSRWHQAEVRVAAAAPAADPERRARRCG